MLKYSPIFLVVFLLWSISLAAQTGQPVLLPTDSTLVAIPDSGIERNHWLRHFFTHDYPNPRKAVLFAIIPGGGQIYNKKWWKLPLVYGALTGMVYLELGNIKQHRALVYNYRLLKDGNPNTNPTQSPYNRIDEVSMKSYRDQYERYVELSSLGLGLVYLLTITDAFVDAHLHSFDVSDDLSFRIKPSFQGIGSTPSIGVGICFSLSRTHSPLKINATP